MKLEFIESLKKNLKIRYKMFLAFAILISFSVLSFSFLLYLRSSNILIQNTKTSTRQSMRQAADYLSYRLTTSKDISSTAYSDNELKNMIKIFQTEENTNKKIDQYNDLRNKIVSLRLTGDVYNTRLFIEDEFIASLNRSTIMSTKTIEEEDWYLEVLREKGGIVWIPTRAKDFFFPYFEQNIISIARLIPDEYIQGNYLGVLVVDIRESTLNKLINQVPITDSGDVFLIDQSGFVLTSSGEQSKTSLENFRDFIPFENRFRDGESIQKIEKEEFMIFHQKVPNVDWQLVSKIPMAEIRSEANAIFHFMIFILIGIVALSAYFAVRFSRDITYRLEDLSDKMNQIQQNDWNLNIDVEYHDEIGDLQNNFMYMTQQIKNLLEDNKQAALDLRRAELSTLQAQINPHFLYNILDLINWLAVQHEAEDINDIVGKLSKFYRLSLSSGQEIVKFREEIEHIELYVGIQNQRFDNNISLTLDIEEGILDYYTINLILQPLIENAIIHGISEKESKKGSVLIVAYEDIESIVVEINDDGVGMDEKTTKEILEKDKQEGYGVRNVNERLTIRFGPTYGLQYTSKEGYGTTVVVRIPIMESMDDF